MVAVGLVELRDGLQLASVAHAVDERPEDVLLPPLALCVLPLVVPGAGVQQEVGDDVVAGLHGRVVEHQAVLEPLQDDWQRRERQGGQDHGADLLGGVVGTGFDVDVCWGH